MSSNHVVAGKIKYFVPYNGPNSSFPSSHQFLEFGMQNTKFRIRETGCDEKSEPLGSS